jgi:hypothetical protein
MRFSSNNLDQFHAIIFIFIFLGLWLRGFTGVSRNLQDLHRDNIRKLKPGSWLDIEYPFPSVYVPKGFQQEVNSTGKVKFLLTEQRLNLLKKVHIRAVKNRGSNGLVFAGPQGIGKSAVSLLSFQFDILIILYSQEAILIALYCTCQ